MEETERSLHDAIMIVRRAIKNDSIVAGTYQTRVPAAQGKPGKWPQKIPNFAKTQGILFAQVFNPDSKDTGYCEICCEIS